MDLLEGIKGKTLRGVRYHEWTSPDYSSLDWIELIFSDEKSVCLHLGAQEECVEVLAEFSPEAENRELFEMFGDDCVTVRSADHSGTRKWKSFVGCRMTGYATEAGEKGLLTSVTLLFGEKAMRISAGADSLQARALSK